MAHQLLDRHQVRSIVQEVAGKGPPEVVPGDRLDVRLLRPLGESVIDVWKQLVGTLDRFTGESTEELFGDFPVKKYPELAAWWDYITARYSWVKT